MAFTTRVTPPAASSELWLRLQGQVRSQPRPAEPAQKVVHLAPIRLRARFKELHPSAVTAGGMHAGLALSHLALSHLALSHLPLSHLALSHLALSQLPLSHLALSHLPRGLASDPTPLGTGPHGRLV